MRVATTSNFSRVLRYSPQLTPSAAHCPEVPIASAKCKIIAYNTTYCIKWNIVCKVSD